MFGANNANGTNDNLLYDDIIYNFYDDIIDW